MRTVSILPDWYFRRKDIIANNLFSFSIPMELDSAIKLDTLPIRKYLDYDYKVSRPVSEISDGVKVLSQLGEFRVYERFCQVLDDYNKWICSYRCKERRLKQNRIDSVLGVCRFLYCMIPTGSPPVKLFNL